MGASCRCSTIVFGILAGIGVLILIIVGSVVVNEYNLAKSFQPTECRFQDVIELGARPCQYCYTTYTYTRRNGQSTTKSKRKCRPSSFPCVQMKVSFYDNVHSDNSATYFPDAVEMSQTMLVIGRKIYSYNDVFHGMLWPGLLTGIALIGVLITMFDLHKHCWNCLVETPNAVGRARARISRQHNRRAIRRPENREREPLRTAMREPQAINPPQPCIPSAPPQGPPPIGFIKKDDAAYPPQHQGNGSGQMYPPMHSTSFSGASADGAIHPTMTPPYPAAAATIAPSHQETDSIQPSAPPPSYDSVVGGKY